MLPVGLAFPIVGQAVLASEVPTHMHNTLLHVLASLVMLYAQEGSYYEFQFRQLVAVGLPEIVGYEV